MLTLRWLMDLLIYLYLEIHYIFLTSYTANKYKKAQQIRHWIYAYWASQCYRSDYIVINKYSRRLSALVLSDYDIDIRTLSPKQRLTNVLGQIRKIERKYGYICITGIDNYNNEVTRYIANEETYDNINNSKKYKTKILYYYYLLRYYLFYNDVSNIVGVDNELLIKGIEVPYKYNKDTLKCSHVTSVFDIRYFGNVILCKHNLLRYFLIHQKRNNFINYYLTKFDLDRDYMFIGCGYKTTPECLLNERIFHIFGYKITNRLNIRY